MALFSCLCFDILLSSSLLSINVFRLVLMLPAYRMLHLLCFLLTNSKMELIANRYILPVFKCGRIFNWFIHYSRRAMA
jgi:hypothetical protein